MEIQVGEYVRLDNGILGKYVIKQHINYVETSNKAIGFDIENDVVKHSKNIIDLIEVGDIVNGYKILNIENISNCQKKAFTIFEKNKHEHICMWSNEDIKSILTKEQYKNNCYKVGE